ncbi:MAG: glutathione S-transferase family protein [Myxococcota bacterium]
MKLYTNAFSPNARKVHAVAKELGIALDYETVNLAAREHRTPDYLALNPNGKVPTLVDGDATLWESNAIMCYLAGKQDTTLWPKSAERYEVLRWMFWDSSHLAPAVGRIIGQRFFNRDNPNQEVIDKALKEFRRFAAVLDQSLHGKHFILGNEVTLADFAVGVTLSYTVPLALPTAEFQHVARWWENLSKTPAGQELSPPS